MADNFREAIENRERSDFYHGAPEMVEYGPDDDFTDAAEGEPLGEEEQSDEQSAARRRIRLALARARSAADHGGSDRPEEGRRDG